MSENKHIHIVSFDVPYPADYGGVIDVFYRIKALHELGVKITLHCFEYGRGEQSELLKYVDTIHYYKRKKSIFSWFKAIPFIVATRSSNKLLQNLSKDNSPILFEGLHTTFFLNNNELKDRFKFVRTHNIEHEYYDNLVNQSRGIKKFYFSSEAKKLKKYEAILKYSNIVLAIKNSEKTHFAQYCKTIVLPASLPLNESKKFDQTQPFCLFQGNLSVEENIVAVKWLIESVFIPINACDKLLIAGKNPHSSIKSLCSKNGVLLTSNPSELEMSTLVNLARVHVLYSGQATGIKLKLLKTLQTKGHVIANSSITSESQVEELCEISDNSQAFQDSVLKFLKLEMSEEEVINRSSLLNSFYNTKNNCKESIIKFL